MGTVAGVLLHIVNRKAGKYETKPSGRQWMESEGLMRNCPERHTFDFAISGTFLKEVFNQLVGKLAKRLQLVTLKIFGVKKLIEVISDSFAAVPLLGPCWLQHPVMVKDGQQLWSADGFLGEIHTGYWKSSVYSAGFNSPQKVESVSVPS